MPESTSTGALSMEQAALRRGEGPRLEFACPKCGTPGWVEWRQLPHLLRCRGCSNSFWIDKSGHFQSEHEVGTVSERCPRCGQIRQWPKGIPLRQVNCDSCGFEIRIEQRAVPPSLGQNRATSPEGGPPVEKKSPRKPPSRTTLRAIAVGALLVFGLLIASLFWSARPDKELIESVQAFTAAALVGQSQKAQQWVPPEQEASFRMWTLLNPGSESLAQWSQREVRVLSYSSTAARVSVTFQRSINDTEVQYQSWRRVSGGPWQFDAVETLRREE